jgi:hypothetical protein
MPVITLQPQPSQPELCQLLPHLQLLRSAHSQAPCASELNGSAPIESYARWRFRGTVQKVRILLVSEPSRIRMHNAEQEAGVVVPGTRHFWSVGDPGFPAATSRFSSIDEMADCLRRAGESLTITVVAPASTLTFDALEELTSAAAIRGHALGAIPCDQVGDGGTRATSAGQPQWLLFDAVHGHRWSSHGGGLDDLLNEPWDLVAFLGHGDGSHLNLGSGVLCGLYGQVETTVGIDSPDGCRWEPPTCKKQASVPVVYQIGRLRAHTVALLSCSSLSLAGQIYPSNVALAIAAYRSGVAAVLGSTRQVRFSEASLIELLDLMSTMSSMGSVVTELNSRRRIDEDGAIALLGDAATPPPREAARQARLVLTANAPKTVSSRASHAYPTAPATALADDPAGSGRVDLISRFSGQLAALEHVTRGLRWLSRIPDDDDSVARELARVESARRRAAEHIQRERFEIFAARPATADLSRRTDLSMQALTGAVLSLLHTRVLDESHPGAGVGDLVAPALVMFLDRDDPVPLTERCTHCGGIVYRSNLRDPVNRILERARRSCAACGTLSDTGLVRFGLTCHGEARRGGHLVFVVDMAPARPPWPLRGVFQVRDKSRPVAFEMREIEITDGTEIPFHLPDDAGLDLWSARLVAAGGGSIEYARRVFAVGPDPSEG